MSATSLKHPEIFFDKIRPLFGGSLSQSQVEGVNAILKKDAEAPQDSRWLAYELATGFWETAKTMQAVRETLADNDDAAIARLEKSWAAGKLKWVKTPYWRKDANGKSWLGRGLVQLTHLKNYQTLSKATGVDLVTDPTQAMKLDVAVDIMFIGMQKGLFTGRSLSDFFNGTATNWVGARAIINGEDKAEKIAEIAKSFYAAIKAAA